MVTVDEKWIISNKVKRKRSWGARKKHPQTCMKAGLHPKKMKLCIC